MTTRLDLAGSGRAGPSVVLPDSVRLDGSTATRVGAGGRSYLRGYLSAVRLLDVAIVALAVFGSQLARFGGGDDAVYSRLGQLDYTIVSLVLVIGWVVSLHLQRSHDGRLVGHGDQEYKAVFQASTWLFAAVAIIALAFKFDIARGYVLMAFPIGTIALLAGRWSARQWLVRQRRQNKLSDKVLLVGDAGHVEDLVVALGRAPDAGYHVVGACADTTGSTIAGVPVVGSESDVLLQAFERQVDVVAVSSSAGLGTEGLRRLGWALEGTGIGLVVAPGIMDVAGPRVLTRPVQGLPLIHVEAPRFEGPQLLAKAALDRLGALVFLLVLSPVLLGVALLVRKEDGGPILFRQVRVGRDGTTFDMLKFRTMVTDAESMLPTLMEANEGAGPLFKLQDDPRVTGIGRILRKYSLDELPQLLNVLRGEMSLVGPRPPLPREVAEYEAHVRRRLLVKPGMTGLWQINGRSDLSWEESVRLDLYYVENWTAVLDLMILWRTLRVVIAPDSNGAY